MVTISRLEASEFYLLAGVYDKVAPDPDCSIALLARDGDEIVGRVFLVTPTHVEGPWVREDHRGSPLAKRLMQHAAEAAKSCGIRTLFAYAATDQLADYLSRLGYKKEPYTVWSKGL